MGKKFTVVVLCLAIATTVCAIVLAIRVVPHEADLAAARRELADVVPIGTNPGAVWLRLEAYEAQMREINPDYVGLLMVEGAEIFNPVVRGRDNVRYLHTSFGGAENRFGAVFMDYRNVGDDLPHIIIYGHNVGDESGRGLMLNWLFRFLDEQFKAAHPVVVFIEDGKRSEFEIFSVRITDVYDPAYQLDFDAPGSFDAFLERNGAPPDAPQILTLSTCTFGDCEDGRVILQGWLRHVAPVDTAEIQVRWCAVSM